RIASSSPEMWQQICLANQSCVLKVLDEYISLLQEAKTYLITQNEDAVYRLFEQSKNYRNSFQNKAQGSIEMNYALYVDIEDVPGIIAKVATHLGQQEISIKNIGINNNREDFEGVLEILFYDALSVEKSAKLLETNGYTVHRK
ncbi:MAG: prephenate dehydrogenase/arogenate dehydrogenase family protein, partial [Vallitaleaceae bacterium]|nr:prephenate dehydrogenase/arogenate dehydrogenase family protein [Vallitaleaceae bacterium]